MKRKTRKSNFTPRWFNILGLLLIAIGLAGFTYQHLPTPDRSTIMKMATVKLSAGKGHGSGVIISPNFILTVEHVGSEGKGEPMDVLFADGSKGKAVLVWSDPNRDVALMALVTATKLAPAKLAKSTLHIGDPVWSVGYPLLLPLSVQHGEVASSDFLAADANPMEPMLQYEVIINCAILRGDSGGPVFNSAGEIVGLNDLFFSDTLPTGMVASVTMTGLSGIIGTQFIADDVRKVVGL